MSTAIILTQNVYHGNYGAILQAYALQRVIREIGYDVSTCADRQLGSNTTLKNTAKTVISAITGREFAYFPPQSVAESITANVRAFIGDHIATVDPGFVRSGGGYAGVVPVDAYIVGSDQVWRKRYSNVLFNLLDFASDQEVKRIAYAASFGADDLNEYPPPLLRESAALAEQFDAVSVREASGVKICAEQWGVEASQMPDPTLLLEVTDYLSLSEGMEADTSTFDSVVSYILDPTPEKTRLIERAASLLDRSIIHLAAQRFRNVKEYRRAPENFVLRPVEEWLLHIANARHVVTDSFHGALFSALFNTPFTVIGNEERGLGRFTSLLDSLGLNQKLALSPDSVSRTALLELGDWDSVNSRIRHERMRGLEFLQNALGTSRE